VKEVLQEQFRVIYKGLSFACSAPAFVANVRKLERKYGLPRQQAMATAYAVLSWSCERVAQSARAKLGESEVMSVARSYLTADELKMAEDYRKRIESLEEGGPMDDELRIIDEIDTALGNTLMEQRPAVADVVKAVEDDLKKGILVGIARMMRDMGYEKWPRDPEGVRDIKNVMNAIARELTMMGRRFMSLMRRELSVLKRLGPERYERVMRRWLAGQPSELEEPEVSEKHELPGGPAGETIPKRCREVLEPEAWGDVPSDGEDPKKVTASKEPPKEEPRKEEQDNPWAICRAQGLEPGTDKFERCVMAVKKRFGMK
jgi:hypothetical protein